MNPIVLIGAGAVILFAGVGFGYWFGNLGRKQESSKASQLQAEIDDYRRDVSEHFSETAARFQSLGTEYRRLFEHMSTGAVALCDANQSGRKLSFAPIELLAETATTIDAGSATVELDGIETPLDAGTEIDAAPTTNSVTEAETADVLSETDVPTAEAETADVLSETDVPTAEVETADVLSETDVPTAEVETADVLSETDVPTAEAESADALNVTEAPKDYSVDSVDDVDFQDDVSIEASAAEELLVEKVETPAEEKTIH